MVVDLPAPFGPTKPVTCPGLTVNDIPSSATAWPKRLRTSATSIVASTVLPFLFRLLPVTWLYGSAGNTGRTEAVIPPLGRARHDQGSSEPGREGLVSRKRLFTRSVRLRLTGLYGGLFVVSGAVLLAIASGLTISGTSEVSAAPNQAVNGPGTALGQAQAKIRDLQGQLSARNTASVSHQLLIGSAIALGIMAAASVVFGWVMAGRALRPVREMTEAAQRISADNLHERLAVSKRSALSAGSSPTPPTSCARR